MKFRNLLITILSIILLSSCVTPAPATKVSYASPESYLISKSIETVAGVYGNPEKSNALGKTIFVSYTAIAKIGSNYSNICFLELQADTDTKIIKKANLGSNLGIDSKKFPLDVRQNCNRAFYRAELAN